jgi:predicted O-methyltransferase YrrM
VDRLSEPSVLGNVRGENELRQGLSQIAFPVDHLAEEPLLAFESELSVRLEKLAGYQAPFGTFHNGTATLGRLCYVACRALRPLAVVETGVAYGVTSAYILKALGENGTGELHSIDLPPLGREAEKYVGYLVPQNLRNRWNLRIGPARKLLPKVFREIGGADIFVHDSLHTYAQMNMEFATAMTALRPGGVLIADDVEGNRAFEEAVLDPRVASWFAIREKNKDAICGAMRMKCP